MSKFSEQTLKSLADAGWQSGRQVDVSRYVAAYDRVGHPVFPQVKAFLEQFGDLQLSYPHFRNPELVDSCNFRAEVAAKIEPPWIREYEDHVGEQLVPIGAASREHMDLLMTEAGAIYATYEDLVCKVGDDYVSALNALCEGHELDCSELEEGEVAADAGKLADSVKERISEAGWTTDRFVSLDVKAVAADGSNVGIPPEVESFLQTYGKLRIKTEPGGELDVNPAIAAGTLDEGHYSEICSRIGVKAITAIGVAQPGSITVVMDDQGRMFGAMPGIPDWLVKYGDNQISGLNAVVLGTGAVTI